MAMLVGTRGPLAGHQIPLGQGGTRLARHEKATVFLDSVTVSRKHARIFYRDGGHYIEDEGSANHTYVNDERLYAPVRLTDGDVVRLGPYTFSFCTEAPPLGSETDLIIRDEVSADPSDHDLSAHNPARQLETVLALSQHLARTLEPSALLGKLLDQLLELFQGADRALVLLCEGDSFVLRGHRCRRPDSSTRYPYSRTVIRRALQDGIGILSEDVTTDERFESATSLGVNVRSLLCVPLIAPGGRRLGVVQLDSEEGGGTIGGEELRLLTAVAMQVAVVLENAQLHAELLREERTRQELAVARHIQLRFLPVNFPGPPSHPFDLFADVRTAREVSGDLYDFFFLPDGRLALVVGDVSGKGIPASLFMVTVRTLTRQAGATGQASPTEVLRLVNAGLAVDNPVEVFVTLIYGIYNPANGELVLASAGHLPPLIHRANGKTEFLTLTSGMPVGMDVGELGAVEQHFTLAEDDTLVLYTDGYTEACRVGEHVFFGAERFQEALAGPPQTPRDSAAAIRAAVDRFTEADIPQDDQTILLLRRLAADGDRAHDPFATVRSVPGSST
jgi:serine phosphatase RsbU (regulator of sigma subunit)